MAKVSVIIPTYNCANYLKEAIHSVIAQSFQDFEVIVVDNFSDDDTETIVQSFNDSRVYYYKFANQGVISASRNYGITNSSGEYVAFLDADDIWNSNKLELQVGLLESNKDLAMVFAPFEVISNSKEFDGKIYGPKSVQYSGNIYTDLLNYNFIITSSVVLRRSIIDDLGTFDPAQELVCVEDYELWLRIANKYDCQSVDEVLGLYRVHVNNSSDNSARFNKAIYVLDLQESRKLVEPVVIYNAKASLYFREAWTTITKSPSQAREYLKLSSQYTHNNLKRLAMIWIANILSWMPFLVSWIRENQIDQKLAKTIFNPQRR